MIKQMQARRCRAKAARTGVIRGAQLGGASSGRSEDRIARGLGATDCAGGKEMADSKAKCLDFSARSQVLTTRKNNVSYVRRDVDLLGGSPSTPLDLRLPQDPQRMLDGVREKRAALRQFTYQLQMHTPPTGNYHPEISAEPPARLCQTVNPVGVARNENVGKAFNLRPGPKQGT